VLLLVLFFSAFAVLFVFVVLPEFDAFVLPVVFVCVVLPVSVVVTAENGFFLPAL